MDEEQNLACNSHASHPSHIALSLLAYNCRRKAIVDNGAVVHRYELCYYFLKHVHAYVTSVNRIYWDSEPTDAWTSPVLDLSRKCQYFRRRLFYFSPASILDWSSTALVHLLKWNCLMKLDLQCVNQM
jgi:hypothetical protein